jgi:hypothetical protein
MLVRAFQNRSARHPNQDEGFARRLCGDIWIYGKPDQVLGAGSLAAAWGVRAFDDH